MLGPGGWPSRAQGPRKARNRLFAQIVLVAGSVLSLVHSDRLSGAGTGRSLDEHALGLAAASDENRSAEKGSDQEEDVQTADEGGDDDGNDSVGACVDEAAHDVGPAGEEHQGDQGERDPEGEQDLAGHQ